MIRPRGRPPTPSAMSRPSEPVETVSISCVLLGVAEAHHRALAERALDLGDRGVQRPLAVVAGAPAGHRVGHGLAFSKMDRRTLYPLPGSAGSEAVDAGKLRTYGERELWSRKRFSARRAAAAAPAPCRRGSGQSEANSRQPAGSPSSQAELKRPTTGIARVPIAAAVAGSRVTTLLNAAMQKISATVEA